HSAVINKLKEREFSLRLMRACTDDETDDGEDCVPIEGTDADNYPTTVEYEDGLDIGQGGTTPGMGQETLVDVYQSHKELLDEELALKVVQEGEDGHLYIHLDDGSGPLIGYISHTELYTDEGQNRSEE